MGKPILIGFSKDDRFSQDHFQQFYELATTAGFEIYSSRHTPSLPGIPDQEDHYKNKILVTFGGDGTMLRALKRHRGVPTVGINCGSFGFLSEFEAADLEEAVTFLDAGVWEEEYVNMIQSNYGEKTYLGVNECVISGADTGRPVDLRLMVDGVTMYESRGDGIIINTPIGSTAYNIAAGGSIIAPSIQGLSITPIAPFLTLDRSVILDHKKTVEILNLERTRSCKVFYDGVSQHEMAPGEKFSIKAAEQRSIFLRRPGSFPRRMAIKIANRFPIR